MHDIGARLARLQHSIRESAERHGRDPAGVRLVAVSKRQPASAVASACAAGQRAFGENYVQEAMDKIEALAGLDIEWHFIGPLQGNKTADVARHCAWVHSIDRLRIASRLNDQRPADLPPLEVCIQVNISGEASKHGVAPADLTALAVAVAALPRLRLRGLMALPEPTPDVAAQRAAFAVLARLAAGCPVPLTELSMGTSEDYDAAIAEGATMIRVGTALFGPRE